MQQAFLRSQKPKYNEENYNEWSQLPPNIPIPNTSSVSALQITFERLIYLNQMKSEHQPLELKLEWWGMKKPHSLVYDQMKLCRGKYVLCTPIDRLLTYLNDMKLLGIEICNKYRNIGKSYLNFMVLKGWKGQYFEGSLDIKQGSKKIGEFSFSIEVVKVQNPYLSNMVLNKIDEAAQKGIQIKINPPLSTQVNKRSSLSDYDFAANQQIEQNYDTSNKKPQINQRPTNKTIISSEQNYHQTINHYDFIAGTRKTIDKVPRIIQEPVFRPRNQPNYETELIRLVQDYNILFGKGSNPLLSKNIAENAVQIQIVKIETTQNQAQIEVIVPLIDGNTNIYKLCAGGLIKLQFAGTVSQNQLINYLRSAVIVFKQKEKLEGSVKLSKILSHCDEVVQIQLIDKDGKRQAKRSKGTCWIKTIPPKPNKETVVITQPLEKPKDHIETKKQEPQIKPEEYVLLNIKAFNPIQNSNRPYNLFLRIYCNQSIVGQTNTLWNKNFFFFDQKVTCKMVGNLLSFEICDRQKSIIRLAVGELILSSPIGINLQIPVKTRHMGSQVVTGYISLDYFKNGFQSITKMAVAFNQKHKNQQDHLEKDLRQKQNIIDEPQNDVLNEEAVIQEENKENERRNEKEQEQTNYQKELLPKRPHVNEQRLNIFQIFNRIFTYLYSNTQIIALLSQKDNHKVTEFLSILEPLVSKAIISAANLNEMVTHLLFKVDKTDNVNKVNTLAFRDSYEAFLTYYGQIIQEKDEASARFLSILQSMGLSINDLEYQLKGSKKIWERMNELCSGHKGSHINIIQKLKKYYQASNPIDKRHGVYGSLSGAQFCDSLRRYEVYETTEGSEINEVLLCQKIYQNLVVLLLDIEPNIEYYSYYELIEFLEMQEIILSFWQLLNLRQYLAKYAIQKTLPKYPNVRKEHQNSSGAFKEVQQIKENHRTNGEEYNNKPTISKSPTFGYLHQPEHMNPDLLSSQNHMVDSLALKMQNLPISPINYNSNQTNFNQAKATFSNLKYKIADFYVNDLRIGIDSFDSLTANNYKSNPISEVPYSKQIGSSNEVIQKDDSAISQKYNNQKKNEKESYKSVSLQENNTVVLKLQNIEKTFTYQVEIYFQQLSEAIYLQCMHDQWSAIVSEEGQYLGGLLIN